MSVMSNSRKRDGAVCSAHFGLMRTNIGGATRRMQPPSLGLSDQRSNPNRVVFLILVRSLVWSALPNLPRAEKSALLMTDLWGLVFLSPPVKQTVFACSYLPKLYKP